MREPSEEVARRVATEVAFQERIKAEAAKLATALIQSYLGPDHKAIDMRSFHSALSQALRRAREQGRVDRSGDVLSL